MEKKLLLIVVLLASFSLFATEYRNLLLNGEFRKPAQDGFPLYWMSRDHTDGYVEAFDQGGPDGGPYIRMSCKRGEAYMRQNYIHLAKRQKYIFSAWFRSKNLKGKQSGIRLSPGTENDFLLPGENQSQWTLIEKEFLAKYDAPQGYEFFIQIDNECGELEVAQVSLRAVTEEGDRGARTQREQMTPSLVPLGLLQYIPRERPWLDFFWVGKLPCAMKELECLFTIDGQPQTVVMPLQEEKMRLSLKNFAHLTGRQQLKLEIRKKATKESVHAQDYQIRFWNVPQADPKGKVLNNLVTLLQRGPLKSGQSFSVVNHRLGWVYFCYKADAGKTTVLTLDGEPLIAAGHPAHFAVRYLEPGIYQLKNVGEDVTGETKLIPDMHMFPLGNTRVPGNECYDWSYAKRYMLPALTSINVGGITPQEKEEMNRIGVRYLSNFGVLNPAKKNDAADLVRRLTEFKDLKMEMYEGTTLDEVEYWDTLAINPYVQALKTFANPTNKILESWVIGPTSPSYCDYISTACNVSQGKGRVLYEVYNRTQYTEEEAKRYYEGNLVHACFYRDIAPVLFPSISMILGNFSLSPLASLDQSARVDFRYALDLQMHAFANDPRLMGLNGVGYWGTQDCDEETLRWCFALLKHYAIEGNKEMLSSHYGYTYFNTLLHNPDFEEGLKGWTVAGNVTVGTQKGFGTNAIRFHGTPYPFGDTFAILTQEGNTPAELSQKMTGLIPGKKYSISYIVADYDDVQKGINDSRRFPLEMRLSDCEICRQSYYVDDRKQPSWMARVNSCKIVFKAKTEECEVLFTTKSAESGRKLVLTFIKARPYFDK